MRVVKNSLKVLAAFAAVALLTGGDGGCSRDSNKARIVSDQRVQADIMGSAQSSEPAYQAKNFLARKAINEWARRMDSPEKLWYIYMRAENGSLIGYHVCRTPPLSFGTSLTNPKQIVDHHDSELVMPAPGLDGIYYGAADPELYFCFDAETDALIHFRIGNTVYYDQPLAGVEAPKLQLEVTSSN